MADAEPDQSDLPPSRIRRKRPLDQQHQQVRSLEPQLYDWLVDLFARYDPIRLIADTWRPDEYRTEVATILPRLLELKRIGAVSEDAVVGIVSEEFVRWFSEGAARPERRYRPAAREIAQELARLAEGGG